MWQYTALISFPVWNQSIVPCPVLTIASWPQYRFLRRQVRWSGILISLRIFQFIVIHTVKGFSIVNEAEVDVFLEFPFFFSMIQQTFTIWSLVPLLFLNSACTSGSSWFTYCWSLTWRILSITLLACKMSAIVQWFEHSLASPLTKGKSLNLSVLLPPYLWNQNVENTCLGTSLVVQRICLAVQGRRVRSLVGELRSHVPACHN